MIKILSSSDWHMDAVTAGRPRLDDFKEYRGKLVHAIREEKPDVTAILGDYMDPGSMLVHGLTTELMWTAAMIVEAMNGGLVIFIAGNHDTVETSDGWTTISPLAAAITGEFMKGLTKVRVYERPHYETFGDFSVLALPYTARAFNDDQHLRDAMTGAKTPSHAVLPLLVFGHRTVPGAVMGSESKEMSRGRDLDLPDLKDLDPALVMNGHYHNAQIVQHHGVEVVIPGSPHRFTFGEAEDDNKGYTIVEV